MIGPARCQIFNANQSVTIDFSISRSGFQDRRLSGVMLVKDLPYGEITPYRQNATYPQAYEDCMNYLYQTGDPLACQRFKQKNQYVYVTI
jgi:hypothetical protein